MALTDKDVIAVRQICREEISRLIRDRVLPGTSAGFSFETAEDMSDEAIEAMARRVTDNVYGREVH